MRAVLLVICLPLLLLGAEARADDADGLESWGPAAEGQRSFEKALLAVPTAERLRAWHDLFCAESHPAGTPADQRMITKLLEAFASLGLETERHDFYAYLPHFVQARVDVFQGQVVSQLPVVEAPVPVDPSIANAVPPAFNAYSATGDVVAPVVYANYGTKEDFEKLAELGVSVEGKVVLARYGRNYRGFKAKYAERYGASAALLYTDPQDSGYAKGLPYPEGGFADPFCIQRGSIKTLAYPGDPLTPFEPATKDAKRLNPAKVALPKIPVQPIGWKAAAAILGRMRGPEVPKGWQGGLPFRYRLTGGEGSQLRAHVQVEQIRKITPSANVLGIVRGRSASKEMIVVGCHFDAWTFGAGDPHAGSIALYEMARSFAELAASGRRPLRTIVFANWAAEEYGIIGSTEWCEANRAALGKHCVAYINLDMAAMGPNFRSAAAPLLKRVIEDAARVVPQARGEGGESVHDRWTKEGTQAAKFGNLGGGSDHVGFYCHLGIPSCSLGGGGSNGVSYHSAYDTLAWYRKIVGEDYAPALMVARMGAVVAARLANAPVLPLDLARPFADMRDHLEAMKENPGQAGGKHLFGSTQQACSVMARRAHGLAVRLRKRAADGRLTPAAHEAANRLLLQSERLWLDPAGLPERPWYRSLYAASDPFSGYASWMLPLVRHAVEVEDGTVSLEAALQRYTAALERHNALLDSLEGLLVAK